MEKAYRKACKELKIPDTLRAKALFLDGANFGLDTATKLMYRFR